VRQRQQAIGFAGHGAHDHHDLMTFTLRAETKLRNTAHALEICNRSTAEFLDDEGQGRDAVPPKIGRVKVPFSQARNALGPLADIRISLTASAQRMGLPAPTVRDVQAEVGALQTADGKRSVLA